jgi:hypothetical protein
MTLMPLIDFLFTVQWHISGISVFGKKLKIPAKNGYEGHEGDEDVKNIKDVLKKGRLL